MQAEISIQITNNATESLKKKRSVECLQSQIQLGNICGINDFSKCKLSQLNLYFTDYIKSTVKNYIKFQNFKQTNPLNYS